MKTGVEKTTEVMKSGSTSTDTNVTNKSGSTSTDTNVTIQSGSTTPDSDVTIIVTSTPVKEKPPPLRFSDVADSSSDDILNANLQTMRKDFFNKCFKVRTTFIY